MRSFMILFLAAVLVALIGCEGEFPFPGILGCNGGVGFVEQICSGEAREPGALELGAQLDSAVYTEVCWTLKYDHGDFDLESSWCAPAIAAESVISTPGVISEGDLVVTATAYTAAGVSKDLFCHGDQAETTVWAYNNGRPVDTRTSSYGDTCELKVELDDFIN